MIESKETGALAIFAVTVASDMAVGGCAQGEQERSNCGVVRGARGTQKARGGCTALPRRVRFHLLHPPLALRTAHQSPFYININYYFHVVS